MIKITTIQRTNDWIAYPEDDSTFWESARNEFEAIGRVYKRMYDENYQSRNEEKGGD